MRGLVAGTVLLLAVLAGAARADVPPRQVEQAVGTWRTEGVASWYGGSLFHNHAMANGKRFDQFGRDAAHRSWPFGTRVLVRYPATGRSEVVTISDRGPFIPGRTIDLSRGTAERIGLASAGVGRVQLEILR